MAGGDAPVPLFLRVEGKSEEDHLPWCVPYVV